MQWETRHLLAVFKFNTTMPKLVCTVRKLSTLMFLNESLQVRCIVVIVTEINLFTFQTVVCTYEIKSLIIVYFNS